VGEETETVDAEVVHQSFNEIGLVDQAVGAVGLGRQSEAEDVEQDDTPVGGEPVNDAVKANDDVGKPCSTRSGGAVSSPMAATSTVKTRCPHRVRSQPRAR
jgi:hypothetical protein